MIASCAHNRFHGPATRASQRARPTGCLRGHRRVCDQYQLRSLRLSHRNCPSVCFGWLGSRQNAAYHEDYARARSFWR